MARAERIIASPEGWAVVVENLPAQVLQRADFRAEDGEQGYVVTMAAEVVAEVDALLSDVGAPADRAMKSAAVDRMVALCDAAGNALLTGIPASEQKGFAVKEAAARAVLAGAALPHHEAILRAEAAQTGETIEELARVVVARSDILATAVGTISGLRRTAAEAIAAAKDQKAVDAALATLAAQLCALAAGTS